MSNPNDSARQFLKESRDELEDFYFIMQNFNPSDPGEVFIHLASMSARISFIRSKIVRRDYGQAMNNFRIREIDPFLEECDRQFKIWSRYLSVINLEADINR